ncbi:hypothetical protein EYF80_032218 [Liparis tanakae]|uniref:Uncharacterized protein n=1 Tax=Liparis tanakae TaxID=230148 RepID=A0A4Z2GY17_9TELE|nr:hypothetical protein EYF80_032218 [Liparis tanakae]
MVDVSLGTEVGGRGHETPSIRLNFEQTGEDALWGRSFRLPLLEALDFTGDNGGISPHPSPADAEDDRGEHLNTYSGAKAQAKRNQGQLIQLPVNSEWDGTQAPGCMVNHQTSPDITRLHQTSPDLIRPHQTPPDLTRPHQTSPDLIRPHQTSPDLTRPHQTSPDSTRHHQTSPDLIRHHQTSSDIIRPHQTSSDLAAPGWNEDVQEPSFPF